MSMGVNEVDMEGASGVQVEGVDGFGFDGGGHCGAYGVILEVACLNQRYRLSSLLVMFFHWNRVSGRSLRWIFSNRHSLSPLVHVY